MSATNQPKLLDKNQVASALGIKPFHANQLMIKGKLGKVQRLPIREGATTLKKVVAEEAVLNYKATRGNGVGKRADGRNKFNTWFTPAELKEFQAWAKGKGIPAAQRANKPQAKKAPKTLDQTI